MPHAITYTHHFSCNIAGATFRQYRSFFPSVSENCRKMFKVLKVQNLFLLFGFLSLSNALQIGYKRRDDPPPTMVCTEEGYFPDPTSCERFVRCIQDGDAPEEYPSFISITSDCPPGTSWCTTIRACTYHTQCAASCNATTVDNSESDSSSSGGSFNEEPMEEISQSCLNDDSGTFIMEKYWTAFGGYVYTMIVNPALSWDMAAETCRKRNCGGLTNVESEDEFNSLVELVNQPGIAGAWVGGRYRNETAQFEWVEGNGTVPKYFWAPREPNNNGGKEDCTGVDTSVGGGNDFDCSIKLPFVCKTPAPAKKLQ